MIEPSGKARFLEEGRNLPLGVDVDLPIEGASLRLQPGSLVVLYTDGLVERADESIDDGLARLAAVAVPADRDPEQLADAILEELLAGERLRDDVALLVLELAPSPSRPLELTFPAETTPSARFAREVADWLEREHVPAGDAKDILLAVWEAATNAVEHGGRDGGTVTVSASIVGDRVLIEVGDDGRWQEPRERENRGLGLRVIRSLMTEVEFDHSDHGTRIYGAIAFPSAGRRRGAATRRTTEPGRWAFPRRSHRVSAWSVRRGTQEVGAPMPPRGVEKGSKRARQYEHIKESLKEQGRSEDTAEEIAARTVNKERARTARPRSRRGSRARTSRRDAAAGYARAGRARAAERRPALRGGEAQGHRGALQMTKARARARRRSRG